MYIYKKNTFGKVCVCDVQGDIAYIQTQAPFGFLGFPSEQASQRDTGPYGSLGSPAAPSMGPWVLWIPGSMGSWGTPPKVVT